MLYLGSGIGGVIGAYIPVLLGDSNPFSGWSLLAGFVGTIVGLWMGYKLGQYIEG
jgi:hypothetical protein